MEKVLGVKSTGDIGLSVFALIILGILGYIIVLMDGNFSDDKMLIFSYCLPFLILFVIIDIIIQVRKPSKMITYDEEYLYLHYTKHTEKILLSDVRQAIPRRTHSRFTNYSFGKITVHTNQGEFQIGRVSDIEYVCVELMNIVRSHIKKESIE